MKIDADYIKDLSVQISAGEQLETDKLEFKRTWYNLKGRKPKDADEFCKDIASIANTPGLEGNIIIGLDGNTGNLSNQPFSNSGLKDPSDLRNLVVKRIVEPVNYDLDLIQIEDVKNKKYIVSLITIPPSIEKPHVIKQFGNRQNFIPIRKGTSINPANKTDIDFMYYDRKNITPEYNIGIVHLRAKLTFNINGGSIEANTEFLIQNIGRQPLALSLSSMVLNPTNLKELNDHLKHWKAKQWLKFKVNDVRAIDYTFPRPILVPYNDISHVRIKYRGENLNLNKYEAPTLAKYRRFLEEMKNYSFRVNFESVNGRNFLSEEFIIEL